MAPKRKEVASSPSKAKKAKLDPVVEKLNQQILQVETALKKASLTSDVQKLLSLVMPLSLGEFNDQRHRFQHQMVEEIASILREVEDSLKQRNNEKLAERDGIAGERPLRDLEANEAAEKLGIQTSEAHRLKELLAEKATTFRVARSALDEAEHAKLLDGQKGKNAEKKRGDFAAALENLTVLKTASPDDADAQKRLRQLMELLKKYNFDESMLIALPAALGKAPDARGRFDLIAISQLESKIDETVAEQTAILAAAAPGLAKCEAAVKEAEESLSAARSEQMAAAKVFDVASKELVTCESIQKSAQKAVRDHAQNLHRLERALRKSEADLEIFQQGPLENFKELCGRVTAPVVKEPAAAVCMDDANTAMAMEEPTAAVSVLEVDVSVPIVPVAA